MDEKMIVVASAGSFYEVAVGIPGLEETWCRGWRCSWCSALFVCADVDEIPPHPCLSRGDGVIAVGP